MPAAQHHWCFILNIQCVIMLFSSLFKVINRCYILNTVHIFMSCIKDTLLSSCKQTKKLYLHPALLIKMYYVYPWVLTNVSSAPSSSWNIYETDSCKCYKSRMVNMDDYSRSFFFFFFFLGCAAAYLATCCVHMFVHAATANNCGKEKR